jgi:hypothetical protein
MMAKMMNLVETAVQKTIASVNDDGKDDEHCGDGCT